MAFTGKTVLFIASRGLGARMLLQTELVPTLQAAGVRVVVMAPEATMPTLSPRIHPESLVLEPMRTPVDAPGEGRIRAALSAVTTTVRRAALDGRRSPAFAIRYRKKRASYRKRWPSWLSLPMHVAVTQGLWRSRSLRRLTCRLDIALLTQSPNRDVFERHDPDLVLATGLGYFPADEIVLQEAARRGVRTAALISGWDNPTTKGYRAVSFDLVVAWSELMRQGIIDLQDIDPDVVKVGGVPQWDPYMIPAALPSRKELNAELGLDPAKRIVFHAAFPPTGDTRPFEAIATALAEATSRGEFGDDVQLVIRLHPKHISPNEDQSTRPYEALTALEGVHLNRPDVAELRDEPSLADGRILGALFKHCHVLVNIFSTTTLEAFLLDRPVVMAMPGPPRSGRNPNSYVGNPLLWYDFVHLRPLVESGAARVASSPEELVEHVQAYLADPSLDRASRRDVAKLECGPTDGHAGERTAKLILEELGVDTGSVPESAPVVRQRSNTTLRT